MPKMNFRFLFILEYSNWQRRTEKGQQRRAKYLRFIQNDFNEIPE